MERRDRRRERHPVGDYVYAHMTEVERAALRRLMRRADGRDEDDDGYCSLGNAGVGVGVEPGERIRVYHMRRLLEEMSQARLLSMGADDIEWRRILRNATETEAGRIRLGRLFAVASGISDEAAFDEDLRAERIAEWQRQRDGLRALGRLGPFDDPPAPARPALLRWAQEGGPIPVLEGEEQLALALKAEAD